MNIKDKCLKMLKLYGTPEHVVAHCKAVSTVAVIVGRELNYHGYHLNIKLIEAASLLHDIARVEEEHDQVGAKYLHALGLHDVASIVAVHMHYPEFNPVDKLKETDIVCLADRVCKEDKFVGVEERMKYVMAKAKGNPKAQEIIGRKKIELLEFVSALENIFGCKLSELIEKEQAKIASD